MDKYGHERQYLVHGKMSSGAQSYATTKWLDLSFRAPLYAILRLSNKPVRDKNVGVWAPNPGVKVIWTSGAHNSSAFLDGVPGDDGVLEDITNGNGGGCEA